MNDRQIAFIMCVNDDRQADESEFYIRCLDVPEHYEVDVIRVREAVSMAAGYNAAMQSSEARYKVYLHQDTRIISQTFIRDMIKVFEEDAAIGMLGCVGCRKLPANGQAVGHWDVGMVYHNCIPGTLTLEQDKEQPVEVEALDGLLLATSRDVRWREDLFDGWDFYDVSQCLEMRRMGWRVVVPCQETPWCYHDNFYSRMLNYQKYCNKMITEYQDIQSFQAMDYSESRKELEQIKEIARKELYELVDKGEKAQFLELFQEQENRGRLHLKDLEVLADIAAAEREAGMERFWLEGASGEQLRGKLLELHRILKRIEYRKDAADGEIYRKLEAYSTPAIKTVLCAYTERPQAVWDRIQEEMWKRQKCYGVLEEKYLQLMNRNICLHTGEGWEELKIMFSDAAFIQTFEKNDSFLEMKFLLEIYEAEVQAGVRHTVLDTEAQNIEELWEPIRNLRFSLWRVKAAGIPEMGEELCRRIQEENISSVALLFVIRSAFEETSDVLAPLADLFLDHQMLVYAYELLKELQKQMPDVADIRELITELERYL